jgi:hypothetical protein
MTEPPSFDSTPPRDRKLEITNEDLWQPDVDRQVEQMRQASTPQLIRSVGAPGQAAATGGLPQAVLTMGLAGLVGGVVGWGASELIAQPFRAESAGNDCLESGFTADACGYEPWYGTGEVMGAIVFVVPFALIVGAVIAGWDGIVARSGKRFWSLVARGLPALVGAGVVGAWIGAEYFKSAVKSAHSLSDLHVPRGIAWALFSAGIGAALGAVSKSSKRAINGALGGAIGGFLGGAIFDSIDLSDTNGVPNRIVGLAITGAAIGVAIGLIETARRDHWIEIVSGGMAGKQFILYSDPTTIGSGHDCGITLIKDAQIAPMHATFQRRGDSLVMRSAGPPVLVNGTVVAEAALGDGDLLQLGTTTLRYRSKQQAMPVGPFPGGPPPSQWSGPPGPPPAPAPGPGAPPPPTWPQGPGA